LGVGRFTLQAFSSAFSMEIELQLAEKLVFRPLLKTPPRTFASAPGRG
jgi:hypothetical protein